MSKRETIQPGGKRYVRRAQDGKFTQEQVVVGKSLPIDRRTKAKTFVSKGWKIVVIRSVDIAH